MPRTYRSFEAVVKLGYQLPSQTLKTNESKFAYIASDEADAQRKARGHLQHHIRSADFVWLDSIVELVDNVRKLIPLPDDLKERRPPAESPSAQSLNAP